MGAGGVGGGGWGGVGLVGGGVWGGGGGVLVGGVWGVGGGWGLGVGVGVGGLWVRGLVVFWGGVWVMVVTLLLETLFVVATKQTRLGSWLLERIAVLLSLSLGLNVRTGSWGENLKDTPLSMNDRISTFKIRCSALKNRCFGMFLDVFG